MSAECNGELGREDGFATSIAGFIARLDGSIFREYLLGIERLTKLRGRGEADGGVYWLSSTAKES